MAYATVDDVTDWLGYTAPEGTATALEHAQRLFQACPQMQPLGVLTRTRTVSDDTGDQVRDSDGELASDDNDIPYSVFTDTFTRPGGQPLYRTRTYGKRELGSTDSVVQTATETKIDVLRDASCAQVEFWIEVGNSSVDRGISHDITRLKGKGYIGSVSVPQYPVLAPRAIQMFQARGNWDPGVETSGYAYDWDAVWWERWG